MTAPIVLGSTTQHCAVSLVEFIGIFCVSTG